MNSRESPGAIGAAAVLAVLTTIGHPPFAAAAQRGTVNSRNTPAVTRDMRYREWMMKALEREGRKKSDADEKQRQLILAQMSEDFRHIQIANNRLTLSRSKGEPPDYEEISDAVAEINKRATRLRRNLAFAEAAKETKAPPAETLQLRTQLAALDGLIVRFINNPLFKESEVLDAAQSDRARRDLERIITLSAEIKKVAQH